MESDQIHLVNDMGNQEVNDLLPFTGENIQELFSLWQNFFQVEQMVFYFCKFFFFFSEEQSTWTYYRTEGYDLKAFAQGELNTVKGHGVLWHCPCLLCREKDSLNYLFL